MCGIAGARISDADLSTTNMADVIEALALGIEHRGKDASGILTVSPTGRIKVRKDALPMSAFLLDHDGIGSGAQLALIHTRLSTQGSEKMNFNNHPVDHGDYIGVHNGMISNDFELFAKHNWKRTAEVDTEAIFAAIHNLGIKPGLEAVEGSMATAFIHQGQPKTLWLARGDYSPLCIIRSEGGSLLFASTPEAVIAGARAMGLAATDEHVTELDEGTIVSADDETILVCPKAFVPDAGYRYFGGSWGKGFKTTTISRGKTPSDVVTNAATDPFDDWDNDVIWDTAQEGDDVYVTTSQGHRIYGRVTDVVDGQAWVEWDDRAMPVEAINVLSSRRGTTKSDNVLELSSGKES